MPFEGLTQKLSDIFRKLRGKGKLTEADVDAALREVRLSLLEADVNYKVVKEFISNIRQRAVGEEVLSSLTPAQQVIKIVYEELAAIMGKDVRRLNLTGSPPAVILLLGLQGSGKTTTAGKLALLLKKQGKHVMCVSCDVWRPAAQRQLEIVAQKAGAGFFTLGGDSEAEDIARAGIAQARRQGYDVVILDTAGRLQIDEDMMEEARKIASVSAPQEKVLVVDAMTGQEACKVAQVFDEKVGISGVILTKLDSDARGGAALSVVKVTGKPVLFASKGEKLEDFEVFHPDRMASRILGMGDVLTLIEKAQEAIDEEKAREFERKLRKNQFTLDDFLEQMRDMRKMGSIGDILRMIPGFSRAKLNIDVDPKDWTRVEAIIQSMTKEERRRPEIIDGSRKKRIAKGSGTSVQDVNRLLKQFSEARKMMSKLSSMDKAGKFPF